MASKLAEAFVELTLRNADLVAGLANAQVSLRQFTARTAGLLTGIGFAGFTVRGMSEFFADTIKSAADLGEAVNKTEVIFGSASGIVTGFAQEMADKFGLVKTTILDAAGTIGGMLQGAGMTTQESARLSTAFVQLAADASSLYNIPLEDALRRIRSGLAGELEPMRMFGADLSVGAVKAEAFRSGIAKVGTELTQQQKVLARSAIIFRDMAHVNGDLANTQDSLSNQLRKVAGDWENMQATLGATMIPVVSELIGLGYDLGAAFEIAFSSVPLDAFTASMQGAAESVIGLRVLVRAVAQNIADAKEMFAALAAGNMLGAGAAATRFIEGSGSKEAEGLLFERLGKGITGFAGDIFSGGQEGKAAAEAERARRRQELMASGPTRGGKPKWHLATETPWSGFAPIGMLGDIGNMVNRAAMLDELDFQRRKLIKQDEWSGGHVTDALSFLKSAQEKILTKPDETAKRQLKELETIRKIVEKGGPKGLIITGPAH